MSTPPRTTPRLGLPIPGDSDPADYVKFTGELGDAVDEAAAGYAGQGLVAERPAAGVPGRLWRVTDPGSLGHLHWDTGAAWAGVGGLQPSIAGRSGGETANPNEVTVMFGSGNLGLPLIPAAFAARQEIANITGADVVVRAQDGNLLSWGIGAQPSLTIPPFQNAVFHANAGDTIWYLISTPPERRKRVWRTIGDDQSDFPNGDPGAWGPDHRMFIVLPTSGWVKITADFSVASYQFEGLAAYVNACLVWINNGVPLYGTFDTNKVHDNYNVANFHITAAVDCSGANAGWTVGIGTAPTIGNQVSYLRNQGGIVPELIVEEIEPPTTLLEADPAWPIGEFPDDPRPPNWQDELTGGKP